MNKDNDLIDRLNKIADSWDNSGYPIDAETVREAIAALSPVLPEDGDCFFYISKTDPHVFRFDSSDASSRGKLPYSKPIPAEAADLIERQQRGIAALYATINEINQRKEKLQHRIEELEGIIKAQNKNAFARIEEAKQAEAQIAEYEKAMEKMANFDAPKWVENFARTKLERIRRMK